MTPPPGVFPNQIAKLLPRLASEHDGEVVATARAIERVLRTAGLDWHALAKQIDAPKTVYAYGFDRSPPPQQHPPDPPPSPKPWKPRERGWSDMKRFEQIAWCETLTRSQSLDSKTLIFVTDVLNRLHYGISFDLNRSKKRLLTKSRNMAKEEGRAARERH